jgi:hypothetical protein
MKLQVLMEVSVKMRAFSDIAPCSVGVRVINMMMEAVCTSETSVYS